MALKFRLIKRLKEQKVEEKVIYALLDFINIYLPFHNSEKASTFEESIESLVFNDDVMEATTIRELYIQRVREHDRKIADKKIKSIQQKELLLRQEESRMRQEESRMRQEESRMRQEAEDRLKAAILSCYN